MGLQRVGHNWVTFTSLHIIHPSLSFVLFILYPQILRNENKGYYLVTCFVFTKYVQYFSFSSVQFSRWVMSNSLWLHESQHARPPCPSPTPGVHSDSRPLSQWCHPVHWISDAIQPSHPLSSPSPPAPKSSQHQSLFQWVNSSHEVAEGLEFQIYHHSFQRNSRADLLQNGLVGSLCSPRDSQESSPTPQFKNINSSALSFLHSPTLTSIHDHWKNHSLD